MDIHVMNQGEEFVDIRGCWQKHWVYQLVSFTVNQNMQLWESLPEFTLEQLLGDDVWQFLVSQGEQDGALICFEYMVEDECFDFPIMQVSKGIQTYAHIAARYIFARAFPLAFSGDKHD